MYITIQYQNDMSLVCKSIRIYIYIVNFKQVNINFEQINIKAKILLNMFKATACITLSL